MKCVVCGKEFIPYSYRSVTCSSACANINRNRRSNELKRLKKAGLVHPFERKCRHCGAAFTTTNHSQFFCKPECTAAHAYEEKLASKKRRWAQKRDERNRVKEMNFFTGDAELEAVLSFLALPDNDPTKDYGIIKNWSQRQKDYYLAEYRKAHGIKKRIRLGIFKGVKTERDEDENELAERVCAQFANEGESVLEDEDNMGFGDDT